VIAVFGDDRAEFWVAEEGGAADAGGGCDGRQRDGLSGGGDLLAAPSQWTPISWLVERIRELSSKLVLSSGIAD
jgi:hypothetical protein